MIFLAEYANEVLHF